MAVIKISDNKDLPPVVKVISGEVVTVSKTRTTQLTF
jgi:hypothetical protein